MSWPFTVATINVLYSDTTGEKTQDLHKCVEAGADLIAGQELGGDNLSRLLGDRWKTFDTGNANESPIAWNSNIFKLKHKYTVRLNNGGPIGDRYIAVGRFEHIPTGQMITFGSCHLIAFAITDSTHPENDSRGDTMVTQVANAADWLKACHDRNEHVIFCGDFNTNYAKDSKVRDHRLAYYNFAVQNNCWPTWRTLGPGKTTGAETPKHLIDWICSTHDSRIIPVHQKVIAIHSDHNTVVATFAINAKGGPDAPDENGGNPPPPEDPDEPYVPPLPYLATPTRFDVTFPEYCR